MPREVTDKIKREIDDLFDLYDADRTGTIDITELGTLLRALGLSPSNAQVRDVMKKYDKDNSKDLTKAEFIQLYEDQNLPEGDSENELRKAFAAFDTDGSGRVSKAELVKALRSMGEPLSEDEVNYMFNSVDLDGSGDLDYSEFCTVMLGKNREAKEEIHAKDEPAAAADAEADAPEKKKKKDIFDELKSRLPGTDRDNADQKKERFDQFNQFDPNGNGYLSLAEVDKGAREVWKLQELTDDLAPILLRAFTAAKDVRKAKGRKAKKQADDYVERSEFRKLVLYVKRYFELWIMFDEVDGSDDRRIDLDEFKGCLPKLEEFGLTLAEADAEAEFSNIDTNGGGKILFQEFSEWALRWQLDADGDRDALDTDDSEPEPETAATEDAGAAAPAEEEKKEEAEDKKKKREIFDEIKSRLPGTERANADQKQARKDQFNQFDPNGNGYLSLAEVDKGAREVWKLHELTDDLAPILLRAFTAAKTVRQRKNKRKNDDDYVQRAEFRMLVVYVKMYFELWVMFDEVDGSDDRRIELDEFKASLPKLEEFGVKIAEEDAEKEFNAIDTNGGGKILFQEFSEWAIKKELDADGDEPDTDDEPASASAPPAEEQTEEEKAADAEAAKEKEEAADKKKKKELFDEIKSRFPGTDRSDADQKKERFDQFNQFDPNGNGYLSLAEVDKGAREVWKLHELTDDLAPILLRAFTAAKDVRKAKGRTKKQADDYVERSEFRKLIVFIRRYFELWVMFDEVDGSDDRRIDLDEFKASLPKLEEFGVKIAEEDAEKEFNAIDTNGGGKILFQEFSEWAIKKELEADGEELDTDDEPPVNEEDEEEK